MACAADTVEEGLETYEGAIKTAEGTDVCAVTVEHGKRQVKPETAAFRASFTQAAAAHAIADLVGLSCSNLKQNTISYAIPERQVIQLAQLHVAACMLEGNWGAVYCLQPGARLGCAT